MYDGRKILSARAIKTTPKSEKEERLIFLAKEVLRTLKGHEIHLLAIEGAAYGRHNRAYDLGAVSGVIRVQLYRRGIPFIEPAPTTVKKYISGNGRASKTDVIRAIQPYFSTKSADVADAVALAVYAHHRYESSVVEDGVREI